jgi:hypothetical protein
MSLRARSLLTSALLSVALSVAACRVNPPDREIQQADAAVAAALQAGADRWAAEEFAAAKEAVKHAHEAVEQHDYRLALNHALDSRERAETAAAQASAAVAAAKTEADRAISAAVTAVRAATASIKAKEASRLLSAKLLAGPRAGLALAETRVQGARTAWDQRDYAAATKAATDATEQLAVTLASLDDLPAAPTRRRR